MRAGFNPLLLFIFLTAYADSFNKLILSADLPDLKENNLLIKNEKYPLPYYKSFQNSAD